MATHVYALSEQEAEHVAELVAELDTTDTANPEFFVRLNVLAHRLPHRLRETLAQFRLGDTGWAALVLSNLPIGAPDLPPTPPHWREAPSGDHTDALLLLLSALVGDAFGWTTQQDGRLVHNVLPIRENEEVQVGSSSKVRLTLHTEDAFHPLRPDFVALLSLRNPDDVPTEIATLTDGDLDADDLAALFEDAYYIAPDLSHTPEQNSADAVGRADFARLTHPEQPAFHSILYGDPATPFIRFDRYYTQQASSDRHWRALENLERVLEKNVEEVVLRPGDLCLIDNARAVHGRSPFRARYDGTDHWLKRLCLTLDLRKSRGGRAGGGRLIGAAR